MSLTNLAQIKGGRELQNNVAALLKSYEAAKVLTQIAKSGNTADGNYNVEELLAKLKSQIDAMAGGSGKEGDGVNLASLALAINELKNKEIKDVVRLEIPVVAGVGKIPQELDTKVPGVDKGIALPVYTKDNEVVLNEKGEQLTISLATGVFNGVPSEVDVDASAKAADGATVYKAKADFTAKAFPAGKWTLATLPADALLDNNEIQLVAYNSALNKLVVELAKDKSLIEDVKAKVGEKAVQEQLAAATKELQDEVTKKVAKEDVVDVIGETPVDGKVASEKAVAVAIKAVKDAAAADAKTAAEKNAADLKGVSDNATAIDTRVKAIEGAQETQASEKIAVTAAVASPVTEFTLANVPSKKLVNAVINHLVYHEGEDFTVDRVTKKVVWTNTEAAGGFNIDSELTDAVRFEYFFKVAGTPVDPGKDKPADPTPVTPPSSDENIEWSVDVTVPASRVAVDIKPYLTEAQKADITDDSAGGVNYDGANRTIAVYFVGREDYKLSKPVLMKWADNASTKDPVLVDAIYNDIKSVDKNYSRNDYADTTYTLDSDRVLGARSGSYPLIFRVAKLKTPISNTY